MALSSIASMVTAGTTTCTLTCTGLAEACDPSKATMVKALSRPMALLAGVQTSSSPSLSSVVPGTTATPSFVSVPVLTASTRKLRRVPASGSASLPAAIRSA